MFSATMQSPGLLSAVRPPSILEAAATCRQSFEECLSIDRLMDREWAENRLADFNLWAAGVGAFAKKGASLDQRLVFKPDVREVIVNLLYMLKAFVGQCQDHGRADVKGDASPGSAQPGESAKFHRGRSKTSGLSPAPRSFSPWSDASSSESVLEVEERPASPNPALSEAIRNTETILDQLARLAVAIRRSGVHSRLQKADRSFNFDGHEKLRQHLNLIVLCQPSREGNIACQIDPKELTSIQQRLIKANLRRRNRFMYAQSHSKKLEGRPAMPKLEMTNFAAQKPMITGTETLERKHAEATISNIKEAAIGQSPLSIINPTIDTKASDVDGSISIPLKPTSSQPAMTQVSSTGSKLVYPRPPRIKPGLNTFKCPCCCQSLPIMFADSGRWRKHIAGDLCPYTCILEDCLKGDELYVTREAWMNHLSKEHTMSQYWVCFACSSPTRLDDKDDFVSHTRTTHQDTISEDQIPILTSVCSQTAPLNVRSCPLCRWAENQNGDIDPASLLDHIAKHVHEFSLRALPWPPNEEQTNEEFVEKSVVRVEEWFARWPTSDQGHEHRPTSNKEKNEEEEDNYFAQNDYFSEDSGHKSMIRDESLSSDKRCLKRFSSTDSQSLESCANSVSSETFLPDWQQLESAKSSHPELTRHLWGFPAEAATPSHNTTRSNSPLSPGSPEELTIQQQRRSNSPPSPGSPEELTIQQQRRSNSPPSPGSPEELTIQHQTTAPGPAPSQFFNNGKENRSSTGLGLRYKFLGSTFANPTQKRPHPVPNRATSVDLETGTQISNKSAHPELTRSPWGFLAEAGTGLKARRMSLNLPDDFTVDVVELYTEFADQSKVIGRRGKTLGKGATSTVRLMTRKGGSSELYAVKEFRRKQPSEKDEDYEMRVKSEYSIAKSLHHPNIVETIRLCTHQGRWNLVMEYCQEGDLFNFVQKGYLTKEDRLSDRLCIFKQLVQGVHYLHNHGIAHRDIRLENILVTSQSKLKITGFGVSEVFSGIHPGLRAAGGECGKDMKEVRLCAPGICSTMPYIAPEIVSETSEYDPRPLDVWSSAIVMLHLIFGGALWPGAEAGHKNYDSLLKGYAKWEAKHPDGGCISEGDYPYVTAFDQMVNPPVLRRILIGMLNPNPAKRYTIADVAKNRWLKTVDCCQVDSYDDPSEAGAAKIVKHNHLPPANSLGIIQRLLG